MPDARLTKNEIRDTYRRIAPVYDWWSWLTERKARDRCLELLALQDGEAVLEVAVGTGQAFEELLLANPSGDVQGVDLTAAMLRRAERRAVATGHTNFGLAVADAYDLPFSSSSFDALVNNYMFDLLPEKDFATVLVEFRRVLKPGGRLLLVNMAGGQRWYNGIWTLVYALSPALLGGCRGVSLVPHLEAGGFDVVRREYISQATFPSEVILAVRTP